MYLAFIFIYAASAVLCPKPGNGAGTMSSGTCTISPLDLNERRLMWFLAEHSLDLGSNVPRATPIGSGGCRIADHSGLPVDEAVVVSCCHLQVPLLPELLSKFPLEFSHGGQSNWMATPVQVGLSLAIAQRAFMHPRYQSLALPMSIPLMK